MNISGLNFSKYTTAKPILKENIESNLQQPTNLLGDLTLNKGTKSEEDTFGPQESRGNPYPGGSCGHEMWEKYYNQYSSASGMSKREARKIATQTLQGLYDKDGVPTWC